MKFQQATVNDLDAVAELFNAYRMFYEKESDLDGAKVFLKERIEKEESTIFVALNGEEYVGFAQLYPVFSSVSMKRAWILNDLYVAEDARKKGVAQKLIDLSIDLAEKTNASALSLETAPDNTNAQKLYEKNNFIQDTTYYRYSLTIK